MRLPKSFSMHKATGSSFIWLRCGVAGKSLVLATRRCFASLRRRPGHAQIADRLQRLQPNVCRSLNRIRRWLLDCIRMELAQQEHSGKELL